MGTPKNDIDSSKECHIPEKTDKSVRCFAKETYAMNAGSLLDWMVNDLGLAASSADLEAQAMAVGMDSQGVELSFVQSDETRHPTISITGMTLASKKGHLAMAAFESICRTNAQLLAAMGTRNAEGNADIPSAMVIRSLEGSHKGHDRLMAEKDTHRVDDSNAPARSVIMADGGISQSALCMQVQANLTGMSVHALQMKEATALGAAMTAALGSGLIKVGSNEQDNHDLLKGMVDAFWAVRQVTRYEPSIKKRRQ